MTCVLYYAYIPDGDDDWYGGDVGVVVLLLQLLKWRVHFYMLYNAEVGKSGDAEVGREVRRREVWAGRREGRAGRRRRTYVATAACTLQRETTRQQQRTVAM